MHLDLILRNGYVVDPANGVNGIHDIGVKNGRIAPVTLSSISEREIDASGCVVVPGLIDFHAHLFDSGSTLSIKPDYMLATGVTSAVDAGTSGYANFPAFFRDVIVHSTVRIKAYLSVYASGQVDATVPENYDPRVYNPAGLRNIFSRYRERLLGLKVKAQGEDAVSVRKTVDLAQELGTAVCVHTTDPPCEMDQIAGMLREGDVLCHCYHGTGPTIMRDGSVTPGVLAARRRGVIFDSASGKGNFSFRIAKAAFAKGFFPDVISTDWTADKLNCSAHCKSLTFLMSRFMDMGMPLTDIVRAVTANPARLIGLQDSVGALSEDMLADIAVLRIEEKNARHVDAFDEEFVTNRLIIPQMTLSGGTIVFCQADFALL